MVRDQLEEWFYTHQQDMTPRTLRINPKADAFIPEGLPCQGLDQKYLVGQTHH